MQNAVARYGDELACIIVEPIAGNMGVVPPCPGFLETLRAATHQSGSLLIFDEVITGFRLAYGGWQNLTGLIPDLTCLGKIIGGGLPVGALGGRREIMEYLAPTGPVYQAGTLSGNPIALSAGIATLDILRGKTTRLSTPWPPVSVPAWSLPEKGALPDQPRRLMFTLFHGGGSGRLCDGSKRHGTFARFFQGMPRRGSSRPCPVRGRLPPCPYG